MLPTYSLAERDRRWRLAQGLMDHESLDALLVWGEREGAAPAPFAFDTYFTNDRPGALVVIPRGAEPVALVPLPMYVSDHYEAALRGDELWIAPENVRVARHPAGVAGVLREHGADRGRVGVVGGEPYPPYYFLPPLPAAVRLGLAQQLPEVELVPVGHKLAALAMPQSDEELVVIRHAARIGDAMAVAMRDAAAPGVSEIEVYAAGVHAAHVRGAADANMLLWSGRESVAWGPPPWSYRPQSARSLESGDVLLAEAFVSYGMKETQHQVAISVGEPDPAFVRAAAAARASYDAGIAALRPGARFAEVTAAMRAPVERAGGGFVHPVLHGLNPFGTVSGVPLAVASLPGAGRYQGMMEIPTVLGELVLEPGMVLAFEPNCAFGRHVANLGGTVVVGDDEPLELNPLTAEVLDATAVAL